MKPDRGNPIEIIRFKFSSIIYQSLQLSPTDQYLNFRRTLVDIQQSIMPYYLLLE